MKKIIVSVVAICAAIPAYCDCTGATCRPTKYKIISVTAHDTDSMNASDAVKDMAEYIVPGPGPRLYDGPREYNRWYVGGRFDLNLASWENKMTGGIKQTKDYIFHPAFGGNMFVGYRVNPAFRVDGELGYISALSDSNDGASMRLNIPYLTANAYYDFINGFYIGGGLGLGLNILHTDWAGFTDASATTTRLSPIFALMGGYNYYITQNVALDFRLRLSGMPGFERKFHLVDGGNSVKMSQGFMVNTALSVGVRYEF